MPTVHSHFTRSPFSVDIFRHNNSIIMKIGRYLQMLIMSNQWKQELKRVKTPDFTDAPFVWPTL